MRILLPLLACAVLAGCLHGADVQFSVRNMTDSPQAGRLWVENHEGTILLDWSFEVAPDNATAAREGRVFLAKGDYVFGAESGMRSISETIRVTGQLSGVNLEIRHDSMAFRESIK